MAVKKYSQS